MAHAQYGRSPDVHVYTWAAGCSRGIFCAEVWTVLATPSHVRQKFQGGDISHETFHAGEQLKCVLAKFGSTFLL